MRRNVLYLEGKWNSTREQLITASDAGLYVPLTAHSVNIVADGDVELEVKINGKYISSSQAGSDVVFDNGRAYVVVDEARLYNLVDGEYGDYLLTLRTSEGFAFNAFTFG